MSIKQELEELRQRALTELKAIKDKSGLAELEIKYLGRKGEIARAFKNLKVVVAEEKPVLGELANQVKAEIEQAFIKAKSSILSSDQTRAVDLTIPGLKPLVGHMHPVLQVQRDLENLFRSMGFLVLDGPELESEYYNFEALNIPSWHPARDTQDTFYVKGGSEENRWLLRTHTSNMQVRALEKYGAPLRVVVPGRVFRYEATDASHDTQFWQMEGLVVDKDISISHLIATMKALLTGIFQREVEVRLRPGYFPFVEPGFELDMNCLVCKGMGCSVCKQSGWAELVGCGLVHPRVLEYGGLDPKEYSGFAFGLGFSRLVMMRYKIDDIRLFLAGDARFLEQF